VSSDSLWPSIVKVVAVYFVATFFVLLAVALLVQQVR
jgi:hypothetical protein